MHIWCIPRFFGRVFLDIIPFFSKTNPGQGPPFSREPIHFIVGGLSSDAGRSNTRSIKSYERGADRFMGVHDNDIHRMSSL